MSRFYFFGGYPSSPYGQNPKTAISSPCFSAVRLLKTVSTLIRLSFSIRLLHVKRNVGPRKINVRKMKRRFRRMFATRLYNINARARVYSDFPEISSGGADVVRYSDNVKRTFFFFFTTAFRIRATSSPTKRVSFKTFVMIKMTIIFYADTSPTVRRLFATETRR